MAVLDAVRRVKRGVMGAGEGGRGRTRRTVEWQNSAPDLPLASASPDMIRWSRVLLSRTRDAARSY